MKRTHLAAILATAAIAFSCTMEEPVKSDSMVFNPTATVTDFVLDGTTKTSFTISDNKVDFAFNDDDILRIYPLNPVGDGLRFTVKDNKGTTCEFDGGGFGLFEGLSYAAFYPGCDEIVPDATEIPVDYTGQSMMSKEAWDLSAVDYLVASIPAVEGSCNFSMKHIGALMVLDVTFEEAGSYNELSLTSDNAAFITEGIVDLTADEISIEPETTSDNITLALGGADGISVDEGETVRFVMMIAPVDMSNSTITMTLTNGYDEISAEIEGKNYQAGKAFKVLGSPVSLGDPINLSAAGTANSYIVPSSGTYKFNATVKGNTGETIESAIYAEVLWESFGTTTAPERGEIIASVELSDDGYVVFCTPEDLKDGNALIAVKNAAGTILWSWHIWVCNGFDPDEAAQTYANDAGTMMDRNLGALSSTKGDALSSGLLYQWGRKDPFMGAASLTQNILAEATPAFPTPNPGPNTIDYSVKHPTEFISFGSFDWLTTMDTSRWGKYKTKYDPCPPGWKVPTGGTSGFYAKAFGTSSSFVNNSYWNATLHGLVLPASIAGTEAWYPAAGARGWGDARLVNSGEDVEVYSSLYGSGYAAYVFCGHIDGPIYPSVYCISSSAYDYFHAVDARAVRCVKEFSDGMDNPGSDTEGESGNNPEGGVNSSTPDGGMNVLYYGCQLFSSHADIDIYTSNMIHYENSYGISPLKRNWSSAECEFNGVTYNLTATDGWSGINGGNSTYSTYSFIWAFKDQLIMNALKNASEELPVKIIMTDVNGNRYVFTYTEPQDGNYSFYKYQP